jgi:hypothetical protein
MVTAAQPQILKNNLIKTKTQPLLKRFKRVFFLDEKLI